MESGRKKSTKSRGGASKQQGGSRRGGSNLGPEFTGDVYRPLPPSQPQPYFGQSQPNYPQAYYPQPQHYHPQYNQPNYSQPQYNQEQPSSPFMVPHNRLDFSQEAMASFEPFTYRSPSRHQRSSQQYEERPLPVREEDEGREDEDIVRETQFDIGLEEMNVAAGDEEAEDIVQRKGKFTKRAARVDWSPEEEVALAKAYVHCSTDRVTGNEQTKNSLWRAVLKHFNQQMGGSMRTTHQLHSKWGKMLTQLNLFNGFYIQAERLNKSGCNDKDIMTRALQDYRKKQGTAFRHLGAWEVVKEYEKWTQVPLMGEESDNASAKRRKSSESGNFIPGSSEPDTGASMPDLNEDTGPTRTKRKGKKPVESSNEPDILKASLGGYAAEKQAQTRSLVDSRLKVDTESMSLLAKQKEAVEAYVFERDFDFFNKPHHNLSAKMKKVAIARKRMIAEKYGWDLEGIDSDDE